MSHERLAAVIDALGTRAFHDAVIGYLSQRYGGLSGLVIRYHKSARPEVLVNQTLDEAVQQVYLDGLYLLDPLNNITREQFSARVYSFSDSFEIDSDTSRYHEEIFQRARISDELTWLVLMPDTSMLAVCLDKPDAPFSEADIRLARAELPLIKTLTLKHFRLEFASKLKEQPGVFTRIERLVHLESGRIAESANWRLEFAALAEQDKTRVEHEAVERRRAGGYSEAVLAGDIILSSCIFVLDNERYLQQLMRPRHTISANDYKMIIDNALGDFDISEREQDICFLSLLGYPNSLIADKLNISIGTVKNHKYSIYHKLDITTEREMFNLVLKSIVGAPI